MKERLFDTKIQEIKYNVLKELATLAYDDNIEQGHYLIPKTIVPGPKATMRCCIYRERAVLEERVQLAMGGDKANPNIIEVLDIACDECLVNRYIVTEACRGCIAHRCMDNCPVDAINFVGKRAYIDTNKCIECGKCAKVCPYSAILENIRPCVRSCKINAISIDKNKKAVIDNEKCVACGACVYQCPFGAISDKSYILDAIKILRGSENGKKYKVYAVIAPAIVSQFKYAKIEQVVTGIKNLGFSDVVEAALGADITLYKELEEMGTREKMTTSCCPSFVMLIEKHYPELTKYISSNISPMAETGKIIKAVDKDAKVIFIGPCTSKKMECKKDTVSPYIDTVLTFEELQALLDSRKILVEQLESTALNNASFYGRIFARSGGIGQGIKQLSKELGKKEIEPVILNGLEQCKLAMLKLRKGLIKENFLEGMACEGGCINGACCLHHGQKNTIDVDNYGKQALEHTIQNSVFVYNLNTDEKI